MAGQGEAGQKAGILFFHQICKSQAGLRIRIRIQSGQWIRI
jgi:hypothetical protein